MLPADNFRSSIGRSREDGDGVSKYSTGVANLRGKSILRRRLLSLLEMLDAGGGHSADDRLIASVSHLDDRRIVRHS